MTAKYFFALKGPITGAVKFNVTADDSGSLYIGGVYTTSMSSVKDKLYDGMVYYQQTI